MSWFELYVRGIALVLIIVFWITILSAVTINSECGVILDRKNLMANFTLILAWAGGLLLSAPISGLGS